MKSMTGDSQVSLGLMLPTWLRVTQPCICLDTHVGSSGEGACDTACPGNCHEETVDVPVSQTQEQIVEVLPWKRIPERVAEDVDRGHTSDGHYRDREGDAGCAQSGQKQIGVISRMGLEGVEQVEETAEVQVPKSKVNNTSCKRA